MGKRILKFGMVFAASAIGSLAQDVNYGISVPVTLSGGAMYTHALQRTNPSRSPESAAVRGMFYPTLKLGKHWFGYAAVQARSTPYFYYDAFSPARQLWVDVVQAFVGYSLQRGRAAIVFKAGKLTSAFGSFPLRYDDTENLVLDQPLSYIRKVSMRPDQLSCGTAELLRQRVFAVAAGCGGAIGRGPGLTPVTLYGLPGVQTEISSGRIDARFQLTGGSPSVTRGWGAGGQYLQWAAGSGYTIRHGFRIGVSAFRGPYLDRALAPRLPVGTNVRDFPASGTGIDAQWARGRWTVNGEWHRFSYAAPHFVVSPSVTSGYAEAKTRLTPRLYVAGRAGWFNSGRVVDRAGISARQYMPDLTSVEFAAGGWINRHQLVKVSYSALRTEGQRGTKNDVVGIQFVSTFRAVEAVFR